MQLNKVLAIALLLVVLVGMMGCGGKGDNGGSSSNSKGIDLSNTLSYSDYCASPEYGDGAPSSVSKDFDLTSNTSGDIKVKSIVFLLTWTEDSADAHPPEDTFTMDVKADGITKTISGNNNRLEIVVDESAANATEGEEDTGLPTSWSVDVAISDTGSDPVILGILLIYPDRGNSFQLTVDYEYVEYGDVEAPEE